MSISDTEKNQVWSLPETIELLKAFSMLQSQDETKRFLRDLFSETEIADFSKRWQAARMLDQNQTFVQIQEITGLTPTTIARVNKWLKEGCGGYKDLINRSKPSI